MNCWICSDVADSGEHIIKASDLRAAFGHVSGDNPVFKHTKARVNQPVRGLKSDNLKHNTLICSKCNNERTQRHDLAWERLSAYFRTQKPSVVCGTEVALDTVFPDDVRRCMLGVHLYFVKQFGCLIVEHAVPLDIAAFSSAIRNETPHPKVHISFGVLCTHPPHKTAGITPVTVCQRNGIVAHAYWLYRVNRIVVNIIYAEPSERLKGLVDSWHPSTLTNRIRIASM